MRGHKDVYMLFLISRILHSCLCLFDRQMLVFPFWGKCFLWLMPAIFVENLFEYGGGAS